MFGFIKEKIRRLRVCALHAAFRTAKACDIHGDVLVIAPHPDDEVLGCSGLMQRVMNNGHRVYVAILTGGGKSHSSCCEIEEVVLKDNRRNLSVRAAEILGISFQNLFFLDYPDGSISLNHPQTKQLEALIQKLSPKVIVVPHQGEGWNDHLEAGRIVRNLVDNLSMNIDIYEYCVWFWYYNTWNIDWKQASVLRMTPQEHQRKLQAIDAYVKPLAPCGKPWSGVLPSLVVEASQWNCEIYFKAK